MCDSSHLATKPSNDEMPSEALFSPKSREQSTSADLKDVRPNPAEPEPVTPAAPTHRKYPSDRSNCIALIQSHQLSSSEPRFEDVEEASTWKNFCRKEAEMETSQVSAESTRDFAKSRGNENENSSSTEISGKGSRQLWTSTTGNAPSTESREGLGNLAARSRASDSESTQEHVTEGEIGTPSAEGSFRETPAGVDSQHFCKYRSETEIEAAASETGTGFDAVAETERCFSRHGCETRSRSEPKTCFDEIGETETDLDKPKILSGETETGFGKRFSEPVSHSETDASGKTTTAQWKFDASAIEAVTRQLLQRTLGGVTYEPERCRILSHDLAGQILATITGFIRKRYKLVTFVSIGSLTDNPAIQFGSRCLWDADTDELATIRYANESLFAVVMVYGLYRE